MYVVGCNTIYLIRSLQGFNKLKCGKSLKKTGSLAQGKELVLRIMSFTDTAPGPYIPERRNRGEGQVSTSDSSCPGYGRAREVLLLAHLFIQFPA